MNHKVCLIWESCKETFGSLVINMHIIYVSTLPLSAVYVVVVDDVYTVCLCRQTTFETCVFCFVVFTFLKRPDFDRIEIIIKIRKGKRKAIKSKIK